MLKWIETTGRSEEDAITAALFQLGLERDDVSVEVIERAKSGFLGFGGNPAKVRVSYQEVDGKACPITEEPPVERAETSSVEVYAPALGAGLHLQMLQQAGKEGPNMLRPLIVRSGGLSGYRAKREESLQRLALKMAGKVVKYRKNMTLEPMNAYERHVIHTALQGNVNGRQSHQLRGGQQLSLVSGHVKSQRISFYIFL